VRLGPGDEAKVAAILLHPAVRSGLFDDTDVPSLIEIAETLADGNAYTLMPAPGVIFTGALFIYSTFLVHQAAVPAVRGAAVVRAGHLAVRWAFENIAGCGKLLGLTPSYNVPAIASAKRIGFRVEGRLTGAVLRDGKQHDLIILGLARGEVL
jgi:hypothetical protein